GPMLVHGSNSAQEFDRHVSAVLPILVVVGSHSVLAGVPAWVTGRVDPILNPVDTKTNHVPHLVDDHLVEIAIVDHILDNEAVELHVAGSRQAIAPLPDRRAGVSLA